MRGRVPGWVCGRVPGCVRGTMSLLGSSSKLFTSFRSTAFV